MLITARFSRLSRYAATLAAMAGCVAGAFGAMPAAPALAKPMSTSVFTYADMPDYDQERLAGNDAAGVYHAGLPNGGKLYCAETSALDALAFLGDHGASNIVGPHLFSGAGSYEQVTSKLSTLGTMMGIEPNKIGTYQSGLESGLLAWNAKYGTTAKHFGLVSEFPGTGDDWQAPNLGIAAFAEAVGNPVLVRFGYYKPVTVKLGGVTVNALQRTGGHFVAMTGFDNGGLNFMDPDDVGGSFTQSAFTNRIQAVNSVTAIFLNGDGTPQRSDRQTETYWNMPGYAGGSAYIEGYTILQPSYTLTAKSNTILVQKASQVARYATALKGTVADAQLSPAGDSAYYSMTNSKTVFKLNLATGVSTALTKVGANVTSLAVDTAGDTIYAAAGRDVSAVSNMGVKGAKTTLDSTVAAIAFDPVRGQIDAVTPKSQAVQVLGSSLATQGTVALPASAVSKATVVNATVDPTSGKLTIKAAGVASTVISAPLPAPAPVNPAVSTTVANTPAISASIPANTPVVVAPTTTATTTASSLASLANAPVVNVTPVVSPIAKTKLGSIVIGHSAATTRHTAVTAPSSIVRASQTVLSAGLQADQPGA